MIHICKSIVVMPKAVLPVFRAKRDLANKKVSKESSVTSQVFRGKGHYVEEGEMY